MNEKIVSTAIVTAGSIVSTAIIGFLTSVVLCGQWWVTPKHKAKAIKKCLEVDKEAAAISDNYKEV